MTSCIEYSIQYIEESPSSQWLQEWKMFKNEFNVEFSSNDGKSKEPKYLNTYATKKGQGMRKTLKVSQSLISMIESTLITISPALL